MQKGDVVFIKEPGHDLYNYRGLVREVSEDGVCAVSVVVSPEEDELINIRQEHLEPSPIDDYAGFFGGPWTLKEE